MGFQYDNSLVELDRAAAAAAFQANNTTPSAPAAASAPPSQQEQLNNDSVGPPTLPSQPAGDADQAVEGDIQQPREYEFVLYDQDRGAAQSEEGATQPVAHNIQQPLQYEFVQYDTTTGLLSIETIVFILAGLMRLLRMIWPADHHEFVGWLAEVMRRAGEETIAECLEGTMDRDDESEGSREYGEENQDPEESAGVMEGGAVGGSR